MQDTTGDMRDPYYARPEISNSDLSEVKKMFLPREVVIDLEKAYAEGTLIDAIISEPNKVDYFKRRVIGYPYQFTADDFERSKQMKKSFDADPFCKNIVTMAKKGMVSFQKVTIRHGFEIEHDGIKFKMNMRCKWDYFANDFDFGGDFKSTTATSQKQCEELVRYFDYDRSRALYMDLENRSNDILIFISKKNFKVFKVPVKRDGEIYKDGKRKYQELAWLHYSLFGDVKI